MTSYTLEGNRDESTGSHKAYVFGGCTSTCASPAALLKMERYYLMVGILLADFFFCLGYVL